MVVGAGVCKVSEMGVGGSSSSEHSGELTSGSRNTRSQVGMGNTGGGTDSSYSAGADLMEIGRPDIVVAVGGVATIVEKRSTAFIALLAGV